MRAMICHRIFGICMVAGFLTMGRTAVFAAEFIPLGYLPGGFAFSDAWAVSADGSTVVGQASTPAGFETVRWTFPQGIEPLGIRVGSPGAGGFGRWQCSRWYSRH